MVDCPQPDTWLTEKADGLAMSPAMAYRVKVLDPSIEPLLNLPALLSCVWIRVDVAVVTRGQKSAVRAGGDASQEAPDSILQAHQHQEGQ